MNRQMMLAGMMRGRILAQELNPDILVRAPGNAAAARRMSARRQQKRERVRKRERPFDGKLCAELGNIDDRAGTNRAADIDPGGNVHHVSRDPAALFARVLQNAPRRELLGRKPRVTGHLHLLHRRPTPAEKAKRRSVPCGLTGLLKLSSRREGNFADLDSLMILSPCAPLHSSRRA